jgi:hypothetical protein
MRERFYSFIYGTWAGAMLHRGRFVNGLRDGLWKVSNPDGSLAWEIT